MKKILVVGSGGREHALAWKLIQSPSTEIVYVAPGNAGSHLEKGITNIDISSDDVNKLLDFAKTNAIDLTIIGPEAPLVAGIVDTFLLNNLTVLGPDKYCAQLEGSKSFAKKFMQQFSIPTAAYAEFTDLAATIEYLQSQKYPCVIKADGLAAGKGVVIAQTFNEAKQAVETMLDGSAHGEAGKKVVIEEFLPGEEVSFICLVDNTSVVPLASSQDHKARDNGDQGPNTGGMGAYSPAPIVTEELHNKIMQKVIYPTIQGFHHLNHPFRGFLYAGLMINHEGEPKVLEFNCRFGDPETQPIMLRLQSDFSQLCWLAANNKLAEADLVWDSRSALGVVMAAGGYPAAYDKGMAISGLDEITDQNVKVFHAGTTMDNGVIKTSGGRVLCVTALGEEIKSAQQKAYENVKKISWDGAFYRDDIGHRALK
jgi:phosphoribosylamine--glycine ligase